AVLLGGVDDGAIDQHVGGGIARAVGDKIGVGGAGGAGGADHAWSEVQQAQRIASDVGQGQHVAVVDHLPESRNGGVEQGRLAGDFDAGSQLADVQDNVKGCL